MAWTDLDIWALSILFRRSRSKAVAAARTIGPCLIFFRQLSGIPMDTLNNFGIFKGYFQIFLFYKKEDVDILVL